MLRILNIIKTIFSNKKKFGDVAFYDVNKVGLKNVAGTQINPATEEKQDGIIAAIGGISAGGGYEVVGLKNVADDRINPATETTLLNLLYGSTFNNVVGEVQTSPTQYTVLDRLKTINTTLDNIGEVQVNPTTNTVLGRLKDLLTGIVLSSGTAIIGKFGIDQTTPGTTNGVYVNNTPDVKNKYVLPLATNTTSTLTLTSASTAYQITEPGSDFMVTYCNMSDTDMYWGFATLTTGGVLLPKNGGTLVLKCVANNSPFFYCASAGKVLNYTTTLI